MLLRKSCRGRESTERGQPQRHHRKANQQRSRSKAGHAGQCSTPRTTEPTPIAVRLRMRPVCYNSGHGESNEIPAPGEAADSAASRSGREAGHDHDPARRAADDHPRDGVRQGSRRRTRKSTTPTELNEFLGKWPVVWVDVVGLGSEETLRAIAADVSHSSARAGRRGPRPPAGESRSVRREPVHRDADSRSVARAALRAIQPVPGQELPGDVSGAAGRLLRPGPRRHAPEGERRAARRSARIIWRIG